jgi:hypothetical protein
MNKLFEDIRTIAHKEIEKLKLTINDSLDKLYEQTRPSDQKLEEKLPAKRLMKSSEQESQKRQKTEENIQKSRNDDLKPDQKDSKKNEDHQKFPESRKEDRKSEDPKKSEDLKKHEEPKKPEEKQEKSSKSFKSQTPSKDPVSEESDSDSMGLGSSDSESQKSSEESEKPKKSSKLEKIETDQKPSKLSDLPKTREGLSTVLKALDEPGDRLEDIFDYFLAILDGQDQDLKDRVLRTNWEKKMKDVELTPILKKKLRKIIKPAALAPTIDHYNDLHIIKSKLEVAINRKSDSEITASFKRIDEKIRENLSEKEAALLKELLYLVENLVKTSKNGEIRKVANGLREKISSKVDSLCRKKNK